MPGTGPQSFINLGKDIAEVLVQLDDPEVREYGLRTPFGLFTRGMAIATKGFSAGGYRERIKTQRPRDTYALGATSGSTTVPTPHGKYRYEDMIYLREHFNDILSTIKYEEAFVDYVNAAPTYQDGLEALGAKLMADVLLDYQHTVDILQVADRVGILGTIVACTNAGGTTISHGGTAADDDTSWLGTAPYGTDPLTNVAWSGKYKFVLHLGVDCIMRAFEPGMKLSICTVPTSYGTTSWVGAGVATVLNDYADSGGTHGMSTEIIVDEMPEVVDLDTNGAVMKVPCAMYYTDTTGHKAAVLDVIEAVTAGAVGTGDVVTLWAGNIATGTTAWTFGPNFGIQGLLHWFSRSDIQDAGGACSTALKDTATNTLCREASGNMSFWYPYMKDLTPTTQITCAHVKQVYTNLSWRNSPALPIANTQIINTLAKEVGEGTFRQTIQTWDPGANEKWTAYGLQGVTIQGPGLTPIRIILNDWIPPMYVPFVDPSVLVLMSPKAGEWKNLGTGSIWFEGRSSAGAIQLNSQAFYMRGLQQHARDLWSWGGVRFCKP
jgi:hypothetical protein